MKRAALHTRVSTVDQHPESQLLDLRQQAAQRAYQVVHEYTNRVSAPRLQAAPKPLPKPASAMPIL